MSRLYEHEAPGIRSEQRAVRNSTVIPTAQPGGRTDRPSLALRKKERSRRPKFTTEPRRRPETLIGPPPIIARIDSSVER